MDGLVMTGKIRRDSNSVHRFTPIIMISGYGNIEKVFEARDMGVSEYIIKPITAGRVYDHICNIIERPRDFVACPTFNGPCRRRRANSSYGGGEERRKITQVNDGGPAQNDADVLPID